MRSVALGRYHHGRRLTATTLIHERVALAREGRNPFVITRMGSGWAVMADHQVLPGSCLLLPDPVVEHLTDLSLDRRAAYLIDMSRMGDALLAVTDAVRINYEILGNTAPALHAHVVPRYRWEPAAYRPQPVWAYPRRQRTSVPFVASTHGGLRDALSRALAERARRDHG